MDDTGRREDRVWRAVDFVKVDTGATVFVFDIANNKWRMIAAIHFVATKPLAAGFTSCGFSRTPSTTPNKWKRSCNDEDEESKAALPTTFASLNAMLPLRPINDRIDLGNAMEVVDRLAVLAKRTADQEDYLETLSTLIEKYEADTIAPPAVTPLASLQYCWTRTR